jgi:hypothetical protein
MNDLEKLATTVKEAILTPDQVRALWGTALPEGAELSIGKLPDGSPGLAIRWRVGSPPQETTPAPTPTTAPPTEKKPTATKDRATPAPRPVQEGAP